LERIWYANKEIPNVQISRDFFSEIQIKVIHPFLDFYDHHCPNLESGCPYENGISSGDKEFELLEEDMPRECAPTVTPKILVRVRISVAKIRPAFFGL
jgi:hypothetical protein